MRAILISVGFALCGCTPFHQEWRPAVKPCEIWIVDHTRRNAVCISREEWERYWRPVLIPN